MNVFFAQEEIDFLNTMASKYGFKTTEHGVEICSLEIASDYNFKLGWSTHFRDYQGLSSFWTVINSAGPNYESLHLMECKEESFLLSIFNCVEDIDISTSHKADLITQLNKIFNADYYNLLSFGAIPKSEIPYTYKELKDFLSKISITRKDATLFVMSFSDIPIPVIRISEDKNNIYAQLVNLRDGNTPFILKELTAKALRGEVVLRMSDKYNFTVEEIVRYDSKFAEGVRAASDLLK